MRGETLLSLPMIERTRLSSPSVEKQTFHIVLDSSAAPLLYEVGDCLGIYPENRRSDVESLLKRMALSGEERVADRGGEESTFREFLLKRANLERLPEDLTPHTAQTLASLLPPLLPRFYSIASSRHLVGPEIHLLVGALENGVCSDFLCTDAPLGTPIRCFLQRARDFILPPHDKPLIMVGPGTGLAPFRGFMQERELQGATGESWLFFGERHEAHHYYYREYWERLVHQGKLRLDLAFSRDTSEKIYVQHRMREAKEELWRWLQKGGYLYICGDASRMAKEVETTIKWIFQVVGGHSEEEAKLNLKQLRKEKRYVRDVY